MSEYQIGQDMTALKLSNTALTKAIANQAQALQQTRDVLEKLAAIQGLEYDEKKKEWLRCEPALVSDMSDGWKKSHERTD